VRFKTWLLAEYPRLSQACGLLAVIISGAALIGWFTNSAILKGISGAFIPMAPNTAIVFLLTGTSLIVIGSRAGRFLKITRVTMIIACILVVARMSEYLTSVELRVDHWLFHFPSERIGLAPVGKMAFLTALRR